MRALRRYLPLTLALGLAAVLVPALAQSAPPPSTGSFTAADNTWNAAGGGSTVTIAKGGTVSFGYPSGGSTHNVVFDSKAPQSCTQTGPAPTGAVPPLPSTPSSPGWSGKCTFADLGDYKFHCGLHGATMTGAVKVAADAAPITPAAKNLKLKTSQRGTKVKGSVDVTNDGSSVDVRAFARLKALGINKVGQRKVGRFVDLSVDAETKSFKVKLNKAARRAVRRNGVLKLTVSITVTPPSPGKLYQKFKTVKLRPSA